MVSVVSFNGNGAQLLVSAHLKSLTMLVPQTLDTFMASCMLVLCFSRSNFPDGPKFDPLRVEGMNKIN